MENLTKQERKAKAHAEFLLIAKPMLSITKAVTKAARDEYDSIVLPARIEFRNIIRPAQKEYMKKRAPARRVYKAVIKKAWEEHYSVVTPEYDKLMSIYKEIDSETDI